MENKRLNMNDAIRCLHRYGEYRFPDSMTRLQTREASEKLIRAAQRNDMKCGIDCTYAIGMNSFGFSFAITI